VDTSNLTGVPVNLLGGKLESAYRRCTRSEGDESQKLLASDWRVEDKRNKRFYRLSEEGLTALEWLLEEWRNINGAIEILCEAPEAARRRKV